MLYFRRSLLLPSSKPVVLHFSMATSQAAHEDKIDVLVSIVMHALEVYSFL